jgi:hypothetical protein
MGRYEHADALCASTAESQHGVFNHAQATAAGHTKGTIRRRIQSGRWIRVVPGVYAVAGTPLGWETLCMAVTLWDAGKVVISGTSAAALARLNGFPRAGVIEASTCTTRRPQALPDVRLRRVTAKVLEESVLYEEIPTESLSRVILNLCGRKHPRRERALDQALREEKLHLADVWRLLEAEWTTGRRGIRILREMVGERTPGLALTDSDLEDLYVKLTRDFDLPVGIPQQSMVLPAYGRARFDFGYPLDSSAVEVNSYAFHMNDKEGYDRDALKHRAARLAGITVIPVTYSDLRWRRAETAESLQQLLPNSCAAHRVGAQVPIWRPSTHSAGGGG